MMDKEIDVSRKNFGIKVVIFVILLIAGITLTTLGILGVFSFSSGYSKVTLQADDVKVNNCQVEYYGYVSGNKLTIKKKLADMQNIYSKEINYIYKLLDEKTYDGVINIAYMNANLNKDIKVDHNLYLILNDAYNKTNSDNNYSIFASYQYDRWNNIIINDLKYDPYISSESKIDLEENLKYVNDSTNFNLIFKENDIINFSISQKYQDYLNEYEIDSPLISLNILKDAYLIDYLKDKLNDSSYSDGYLLSKDGYLTTLKNYKESSITMFAINNQKINEACTIKTKADTSYVLYKYFDYVEDKIYSIKKDDSSYLYRYPVINLKDSSASSFAQSFYLEGENITESALILLQLTATNEAAATNYVKENKLQFVYIKDDKVINIFNINESDINVTNKNYVLKTL